MIYKRQIKRLFIIAFLAILILPTLVQISGVEKNIAQNENRALACFPEFRKENPIQFLRDFKIYYVDNFGLRLSLFDMYNHFLRNFLHETPLPKKVVQGKNGWYFLGDEYSQVITETFGGNQFSNADLYTISNRIFEIKTFLASQNIPFYFAIAPNKHTVYKEYLPFKVENNETQLTALEKHLKKEINFELIDLKDFILPAKKSLKVYHKTDSHWNDDGAFLGYQRLMKEIKKGFPKIKTLKTQNFSKTIELSEHGDLLNMLGEKQTEKVLKYHCLDAENAHLVDKELDIPNHFKGNVDIYETRYMKKNKTLRKS